MKKGLCIALAIAMLAISFTACNKKDDEYENITTQTNESGEVYVEKTDKDGIAVTEENGEKVTSILSDEEKSKIDKANNNTTTTTAPANIQDIIGNVSDIENIQSVNPNASKDDLLEEGTSAAKTTLRDDIVGSAIKNQKFTISMNMVGEDGTIPTTISMDGNSMATEVSMSGIDCKMILKDGKTYLAFESTKMYFEMEDTGEFDFSDMTPNADDNTYVGTTTVEKDGKTYICEEYKSDSGTVSKYYFLDNAWVRYESIDGDTISILEISSFKASADSNLFSLKGYTKLDMAALENLGV